MRTGMKLLISLSLLGLAAPAAANVFVELSFARKMAESELVIVGTVTSTTPSRPGRFDGTATVRTLATLKGTPQQEVVVRRQSNIAEADPNCCQVGATYAMFLRRAPNGSGLVSVNGRFGMIRLGPVRDVPEFEVIRNPG